MPDNNGDESIINVLHSTYEGGSWWDASVSAFFEEGDPALPARNPINGLILSTRPPLGENGWPAGREAIGRGTQWEYGWWTPSERVEMVPILEAPDEIREEYVTRHSNGALNEL